MTKNTQPLESLLTYTRLLYLLWPLDAGHNQICHIPDTNTNTACAFITIFIDILFKDPSHVDGSSDVKTDQRMMILCWGTHTSNVYIDSMMMGRKKGSTAVTACNKIYMEVFDGAHRLAINIQLSFLHRFIHLTAKDILTFGSSAPVAFYLNITSLASCWMASWEKKNTHLKMRMTSADNVQITGFIYSLTSLWYLDNDTPDQSILRGH